MFKMFNFFKKENNGGIKESMYRTDSKYDGSIHRGLFLIDGNTFEGAYIRDGHKECYTFVTSAGLSLIPRSKEFKMIKRESMLSLNTEAYIANVVDGKCIPFVQIV